MNGLHRILQLGGLLTVVAFGQKLEDSTFTLRNWGGSAYLDNLVSAEGVLLTHTYGGGMFRSLDLGVSWHPFPLPVNGFTHPAQTLLQFDPTAGLFYGSTFAGIYAATPLGAGWTRIFDGSPFWYSMDGATFASNGWPKDGINVSSDGGRTWKTADTVETGGLPLVAGSCVYVAPGENPVLVSCDGGTTWKSAVGDTLSLSVRTMIRQEKAVMALTQHGLVRTVDSGKSWARWRGNLTEDFLLRDLSQAGNSLFAFSDSVVHRSVDGGRSWMKLSSSDSSQNLPLLAGEMVEAGGALIAKSRQGLKKSTDSGRTWKPIPIRSIRSQIHSLTAQGKVILAHADEGIFLSQDSGATWDSSLPAAARLSWTAFAGSAALHAAGSQDGKVRISTDAGTSWTRPLSFPSNAPVSGLAFFGGTLFASSAGGLWRLSSTDSLWVAAPLPVADSIMTLASSANALLLTARSHLWVMRPEGSMTDKSAGIEISKVMRAWMIDERLFAYTSDGFLHQWNPGTAAWGKLSPFCRHILSLAGKGNLLVAATYMGTAISEDGGSTWYSISNNFTALTLSNGVLYGGDNVGGIWRSRLILPTTWIRSPVSRKARLGGAQTFPAELIERVRRLDGRSIPR